jgi:hypothetical protein
MTRSSVQPIEIERAMEQLRQEREVFEQRKAQEARCFSLRLTMGYVSVLLLFAVILICAAVLFNPERFSDFTVKSAAAALFVDVVGLLVAVWKIALKPDFLTKLEPETRQDLLNADVGDTSVDDEVAE